MAVNIIDLSDLISQEGKQAQKYEELIKQAENEAFKESLKKLRALSIKKLNLLVKLLKEGPWGNWE